MTKRTIAGLALTLIVVAAAVFRFAHEKKGEAADTPPDALPAASVTRVEQGTVANHLRVAGQFTPYQEVDLHAKVSGYIKRINVDIGDRVRVGQTIATLEIPELNAQVVGAQAEVRHSQSEITRGQSEIARAESSHAAVHAAYERLLEASKERPGLVAQQELDDARAKDQDAEAQINVAKAAEEASEQQLGVSKADRLRVQALSDYSVVVSPFNGVITMRYADTGSLIQAGTASNTQAMPVVRVAQSDLLRLRMPVPEADVRFIEPGGDVRINVRALQRVFIGRIVRFTRSLDASTRTMLAEVDVPNKDLSLSPGMYADTDIVLQQHDNVLSIPSQALVDDGDHAYVLAVSPDGRVEKRTVVCGIKGGNRIEITDGLTAGESVIVSGQANYQVNEKVRPQIIDAATDGKETDQ